MEAIKDFIKTSTSSMTAVPKPLKFLRPHYDGLTQLYEEWPAGEDKVGADIIPSFIILKQVAELIGRHIIRTWYDKWG